MNTLAVLGAGPAGFAPLYACQDEQAIRSFLEQGITWFDKRPLHEFAAGSFASYEIPSNSGRRDFSGCLDPQIFSHALGAIPDFHNLEQSNQAILLPKVAELLRETREQISGLMEDTSSELISKVEVKKIEVYPDCFCIFHDGGVTSAQNILFATGGSPKTLMLKNEVFQRKVIDPNGMLTDAKIHQVIGNIMDTKNTANIVIVGASHTGMILAKKIYDLYPNSQIHVVYRENSAIKLFFENEDEAKNANYDYNQNDICPETGRIHRFGGIRGEARDFFLEQKKSNTCVHFHPLEDETYQSADIIIPAIGFRTNTIPMEIAATREQIQFQIGSDGQVDIAPKLRPQYKNCNLLPNFIQQRLQENTFALGLGWGIKEHGVRIDGFNVYVAQARKYLLPHFYTL